MNNDVSEGNSLVLLQSPWYVEVARGLTGGKLEAVMVQLKQYNLAYRAILRSSESKPVKCAPGKESAVARRGCAEGRC
jgi:hypothetical protein